MGIVNRKWIITGGAGFIGCHAAARFRAVAGPDGPGMLITRAE